MATLNELKFLEYAIAMLKEQADEIDKSDLEWYNKAIEALVVYKLELQDWYQSEYNDVYSYDYESVFSY